MQAGNAAGSRAVSYTNTGKYTIMKVTAQGTRDPQRQRYQTIPRVLIFLYRRHPQTQEEEVLLLKGAPTKRLWANHYNGLGGHVEADEDVYAAAQREVQEEAGIADVALSLRGVVNIDTGSDELGPRPGVMMFVFGGEAPLQEVVPSEEGELHWLPLAQLQDYPLVDDLYELAPRVRHGAFFFGHYAPLANGDMQYRFRDG
jgi:8-oxo-dGTP diphosphatase